MLLICDTNTQSYTSFYLTHEYFPEHIKAEEEDLAALTPTSAARITNTSCTGLSNATQQQSPAATAATAVTVDGAAGTEGPPDSATETQAEQQAVSAPAQPTELALKPLTSDQKVCNCHDVTVTM
jgi:hypothetical protein